MAVEAALGLARRLAVPVSDEVARRVGTVAPAVPSSVEARIERVQELRRERRYPESEMEARAALGEAPNDPVLTYYLADALLQQEKHDEAVAVGEEGLAHLGQPREPWLPSSLHKVVADSYLAKDLWEKAREHYRACAQTVHVPTWRAMYYLELGRWLTRHDKPAELASWTREMGDQLERPGQNTAGAYDAMVQWCEEDLGLTPAVVELERKEIEAISKGPRASTRDYIQRALRRLTELYVENGDIPAGAAQLREIGEAYRGQEAEAFSCYYLGLLLDQAPAQAAAALDAFLLAADLAGDLWLAGTGTTYSTPLGSEALAHASEIALETMKDREQGVRLLKRLYEQYGPVGTAGGYAAEQLEQLSEPLPAPGKWALVAECSTMATLGEVIRGGGYVVHAHRFGIEEPSPTHWGAYSLVAGGDSLSLAQVEDLRQYLRAGGSLLVVLAGYTGGYTAHSVLPGLGLSPETGGGGPGGAVGQVTWARELSDHPVTAGLEAVPVSPMWAVGAPADQSLVRTGGRTYVAAGEYGLGRFVVAAVDGTVLDAQPADAAACLDAQAPLRVLLANAIRWLSEPRADPSRQALLTQSMKAERALYNPSGEMSERSVREALALLNAQGDAATPSSWETRLRAAALHERLGDHAAAIRELQALIAATTDEDALAAAYLRLGGCCAAQEKPDADAALQAYERIPGPASRPERMLGWLKAGVLAFRQGRPERAALALQQAARTTPATPLKALALKGLEKIYRERGQTDQADEAAQAVKAMRPDSLRRLRFPEDLEPAEPPGGRH